jgi:hypothetical protein
VVLLRWEVCCARRTGTLERDGDRKDVDGVRMLRVDGVDPMRVGGVNLKRAGAHMYFGECV